MVLQWKVQGQGTVRLMACTTTKVACVAFTLPLALHSPRRPWQEALLPITMWRWGEPRSRWIGPRRCVKRSVPVHLRLCWVVIKNAMFSPFSQLPFELVYSIVWVLARESAPFPSVHHSLPAPTRPLKPTLTHHIIRQSIITCFHKSYSKTMTLWRTMARLPAPAMLLQSHHHKLSWSTTMTMTRMEMT